MMRRYVRSILKIRFAAAISIALLSCVLSNHASALTQGDSSWHRVNPESEEFSILTPLYPAVIVQLSDSLFVEGSNETILEKRRYSGYSNGFIFAIDSYKVKNPHRLLKDIADKPGNHLRFEGDIKRDGFDGKQYRMKAEDYHGQVYYFAAPTHVYVITLAVSDKKDSSLTRFFSSLRLGDTKALAKTPASPMKESEQFAISSGGELGVGGGSNQVQIFKPKDVTRKAIIIWRPEPIYTEEARRNQVQGTVVLRGVFGSNGQVNNLRVISALPDGLTEKAVEAARSIRFFPAEKDGKLVSQYIQIEYNFNLY